MNKKQINRKEMYDTVIAFLDTYAEKWSSIPKVGEFKNEFSNYVGNIEQAQEAQQDAQVFWGKNKKQLKSTVAQKADILNDSLEAFALVTGNRKLANKMAASYSDLNRMRNADFIPAVKEIISEAEANAEILQTEYGVTAEQIEGLKNDLDDFLAINGQPRAYRIASVQATKDLEQLFNDATDALENKLDKVMKIFQRRDTTFYNGYLAAREIVDN
jgi:hypothetical protein